MTTTHKLTLDIQCKGDLQRMDVVQGDTFTRQVDLVMQCGGKDWMVPDCDAVVRYCKPDGTGGIYDTLPDGRPGILYALNTITVELAPQMLTCPGMVWVQVELIRQEQKLATFPFLVVVEPEVAPAGESENYVNWSKAFLPQTTGAQVGQYLKISGVDTAGRIIEVASVDDPADEALTKANTAIQLANEVAQEMEAYSPSGTRSIAEAAMRMASKRLVAPAAAEVGQYVQVAEVDENGAVIAMVAVDAPSGGAGIPGADGEDGATFTPTVAEDGTLSWSNDKGLPNPTPVSIKGPQGEKGTDGKDYSFNPTVYGLPVLYLTGDISPIAVSKDNKVTLGYTYGERSGSCTLKGQGATSYKTAQALGDKGKFNYTINFDTAFEAQSGWGEQKKYCLKANFIDHSHSRNIVSCKLWGMSVKARSKVPTELANLPNGGAIDGFPVVIMLNGAFHGLYTLNIPKDGWMFGLVEDTSKTQAVVGANDHEVATQFKGELAGDESDFELEFVSDENNAAWVTESLNRLINACVNSWGGDLDDVVGQYIDWDSAIDYLIHLVVEKGSDAVDKNFLLVTFDGVKWYFTNYDRDTICGLAWNGSALDRPVSNVSFVECAATSRMWELIYRFKTNALKARYKQLRSTILSESRINQVYENFAWAIPSPVLQEDVKRWTAVPGSSVNNIDQITRWMRQRLETVDAWIDALPEQETPVEPEKPVEIKNWVEYAEDTTAGSLYNGTGYKDDARLSSSGTVSGTAQAGSVVTGFIPYKVGDIIRMKGAQWLGATTNYTGHYYWGVYNSAKAKLGCLASDSYAGGTYGSGITYDETTGITTFDMSKMSQAFQDGCASAAYFRINAYGKGADLIVTVNQEITN